MSQTTQDIALGGAFSGESTDDIALGGAFGSDQSPYAQTLTSDALQSANAAKASELAAQGYADDAEASAIAAEASKVIAVSSSDAAVAAAADVTAGVTASAISATNAAASATSAATSETYASASAASALASKTAAAASELNAASSESTATSQATIATTKASEASTSATNAASSATSANASKIAAAASESASATSAINAAASAVSAATDATDADASATSAAASAATATTKATQASTSATNAASSETNAAASAINADASATSSAASAAEAVTAATNADNSATLATTKASEASTSASNASTSAASAATSAANASTSETNASASEANALASKVAAGTSEVNAGISETNAAASEAAASASATNAAGSAYTASLHEDSASSYATTALEAATDANTSSNSAAQSASNAATSEANAATSEANASTSATNAATSESNALGYKDSAESAATTAITYAGYAQSSSEAAALSSASATNSASAASISETNAELYLDQFTDIYLGAFSTAPITDNDGDPLQVGALYADVSDSRLYFWTGTQWTATLLDANIQALIDNAIANVIDAAPEALDTLNELAAALGDDPNFAATIAAQISSLQSDKADLTEVPAIAREAVGVVSYDLMGFPNRTDSTISFDEGTRVFTLAPTGASFTLYYQGTEHVISSPLTITITDQSGGRYIKYNPTTQALQEGTINGHPSILNDLLVSYIYWDSVNSKAIIFGEERHGSHRDTQWHLSQHLDVGAIWRSGGTLTYALNNNDATVSVSTPLVIADEDLVHTITHGTVTNAYEQVLNGDAEIPVVYLSGTNTVETTPTTAPWKKGTLTVQYNPLTAGSGSLVEANNNSYICYWIVATNDTRYPVKALMGHYQHSNIADAEDEEFDSFGFVVPEICPMYQVVLRAASGTTYGCQIAAVYELGGRKSTATTGFSASSHENLSDRSLSDQHPIAAITGLQTALDSKVTGTGTYNNTNWDTAFGWGDHSVEGYLTSFTETDPIYTASSWYSTTNNSSNWDTAYGWGNHASANYFSAAGGTITGNTTINATLKVQAAVSNAQDFGVTTGTVTINFANANFGNVTCAGNITLATSNLPTSGAATYILRITNGGDYTVGFPVGTKFIGGQTPTLTSGGTDYLAITYDSITATLSVFAIALGVQ